MDRSNARSPKKRYWYILGDGCAKIHEHQVLCISRACKCTWTRKSLDLALLAKLRRVQGLKIREIAAAMGVGRTTVKRGLGALRVRGSGGSQGTINSLNFNEGQ